MSDKRKPKKLLLEETKELRHQVADLELRLSEREAKSRGILEAIPDLMFQLDKNGRYLSYHASSEELLIVPPEEFLGKTVDEVVPPDFAKIVRQFIDKTLNEGGIHLFESELSLNGNLCYFENRMARCGRDSVLVVVRDITGRKKEELATELQGRLLSDIIAAKDTMQALRVGLIEIAEFFDWEYAEVWVPDEEINGLRNTEQWHVPNENLRKYADLTSGMILAEGHGLAGRVMVARGIIYNDSIGSWSQSSKPSVETFRRTGLREALGVPVLAGDSVIAVFCFFTTTTKGHRENTEALITPITTEIAAAVQFRHAADKYLHVLESAPSPMLIVSMDGTIDYQNDACSRLFGYSNSELIGKTIELLVPEKHREEHSGLRAGIDAMSMPRPMGSGLEIFGRMKDGTEIPIDISLNLHKSLHRTQTIVGVVDLREQRKSVEELGAYGARLKELTAHMTDVSERERKSIARDLHDDLGQVLTSLKIDISVLGRKLSVFGESPQILSVSEDLAAMTDTLESSSERLHGFIAKLRPEVLDSLGLVTALEWQTEEFTKRSGVACDFKSYTQDVGVGDATAIAVYRIIQECLTNIARHSQASHCAVRFEQVDGNLVVEVRDNGIGLSIEDVESKGRFGLLGMKERASALLGHVKIESEPGQGTTVCITVPIEPPEVSDD